MSDRAGDRALLVYDGACEFCKTWVGLWRAQTGDDVVYSTFEEARRIAPGSPLLCDPSAVCLIEGSGFAARGAEAAFRLQARAGNKAALWAYRRLPGFARATEWCYRWIARHRPLSLKVTRLLWGRTIGPLAHATVARVFLQGLAAVYFVAFLSLFTQIPGLYGDEGVAPVREAMAAADQAAGPASRWLMPSLVWLAPSAGGMQLVALLGVFASLAAFGGLLLGPSLFACWVFWLSLVAVGGDFMAFQWDALLAEAGFLAVFLVPFRRQTTYAPRLPASEAVLWLYRWLLFRLMFSSGVAKLATGDPNWRNLSALRHHFETQPLPTPLAWYAHRAPDALLRLSTFLMFVVELAVPFLFLMPRRARRLGAIVTIAFQVLLMLTGNYAYFNWLAILLCLPLLDDAWLAGLWARLRRKPAAAPRPIMDVPSRPRRVGIAIASTLAVVLGLLQLGAFFIRPLPSGLGALASAFSPFRIVNGYGLFAIMTTTRPEIVIEGSDDGETWKEFRFRHKPGDVKRPPTMIAPFQPRLDWQMWFAALGAPADSPWFTGLMIRLLQDSPAVTRLLAEDPFPTGPPRQVRATLYLYRFTASEERGRDGAWWRREMKAPFFPSVSLTPR